MIFDLSYYSSQNVNISNTLPLEHLRVFKYVVIIFVKPNVVSYDFHHYQVRRQENDLYTPIVLEETRVKGISKPVLGHT